MLDEAVDAASPVPQSELPGRQSSGRARSEPGVALRFREISSSLRSSSSAWSAHLRQRNGPVCNASGRQAPTRAALTVGAPPREFRDQDCLRQCVRRIRNGRGKQQGEQRKTSWGDPGLARECHFSGLVSRKRQQGAQAQETPGCMPLKGRWISAVMVSKVKPVFRKQLQSVRDNVVVSASLHSPNCLRTSPPQNGARSKFRR